MSTGQRTRVFAFLMMMASAIFGAVVLSVWTLNHYGPTGSISSEKALIRPDYVPILSFEDINTRTGGQSRFVFDGLVYSSFDSKDQKIKEAPVSFDAYTAFYQAVHGDESLSDVHPDVSHLFEKANPSTLTLWIKTEGAAAERRVFQKIQFANEGNFYRIQIIEPYNTADQWAYYHHLGITKKVSGIF